jgi:putative phosphoesterase
MGAYMKILIVSDSHGKNHFLEKVIAKTEPFDLFLHLGDIEGSEDYLEALVSCKTVMVAGNNDFFSDLDKDKIITIGHYKIFMTHGHHYGVNSGTERLKNVARQHGAAIAIFGHTHRPSIDLSGDVWAINPGSISLPRQEGGKPSFVIMDIDDKGLAHFTLNYVERHY